MKNYLILFFIFIFANSFAPIVNKDYEKYEINSKNKVVITQHHIEESNDSIDLRTINALKIRKDIFSKSDRRKVREIAKEMKIKSKWLYQIFTIECLYKGSINTPNPHSGAMGLIGFLPSTAISLGTDTAEIRQMTVSQQLDLTRKYLISMSKGRKQIKSALDLYLLVFRSTAIGQPDSYEISGVGSKISKQNPAFRNDSGTITVRDIKRVMNRNKAFAML